MRSRASATSAAPPPSSTASWSALIAIADHRRSRRRLRSDRVSDLLPDRPRGRVRRGPSTPAASASPAHIRHRPWRRPVIRSPPVRSTSARPAARSSLAPRAVQVAERQAARPSAPSRRSPRATRVVDRDQPPLPQPLGDDPTGQPGLLVAGLEVARPGVEVRGRRQCLGHAVAPRPPRWPGPSVDAVRQARVAQRDVVGEALEQPRLAPAVRAASVATWTSSWLITTCAPARRSPSVTSGLTKHVDRRVGAGRRRPPAWSPRRWRRTSRARRPASRRGRRRSRGPRPRPGERQSGSTRRTTSIPRAARCATASASRAAGRRPSPARRPRAPRTARPRSHSGSRRPVGGARSRRCPARRRPGRTGPRRPLRAGCSSKPRAAR